MNSDMNHQADLTSDMNLSTSRLGISTYLAELKRETDAHLDSRLNFSGDCPLRLANAMRYSVLAPGKRLRPTLALIAAELCGGRRADAYPVCVALESVHSYSLIHDDLPSMDNDDLRRGAPTCHRRFDEATAILAGDALQAFAFEVLATDIKDPLISAKCVGILAQAIGPQGMVGGQADDVVWASTIKNGTGAYDMIGEAIAVSTSDELSDSLTDVPEDPRRAGFAALLHKIHRRKTGALIVAALKLGALSVGGDDERVSVLEEFGQYLGQAFQISDDLLDERGSEASMGKRVHKDVEAGKLTYPSLYGVDTSVELLDRCAERSKDVLSRASAFFDSDSLAFQALRYLVDYVVERKQ